MALLFCSLLIPVFDPVVKGASRDQGVGLWDTQWLSSCAAGQGSTTPDDRTLPWKRRQRSGCLGSGRLRAVPGGVRRWENWGKGPGERDEENEEQTKTGLKSKRGTVGKKGRKSAKKKTTVYCVADVSSYGLMLTG